jgi:hypothetical protein
MKQQKLLQKEAREYLLLQKYFINIERHRHLGLGVREQLSRERQNKTSPNSLSAHRRLNLRCASGFGAIQRTPHPHCPRLVNPVVNNDGFAYSGSGTVAGRRPQYAIARLLQEDARHRCVHNVFN